MVAVSHLSQMSYCLAISVQSFINTLNSKSPQIIKSTLVHEKWALQYCIECGAPQKLNARWNCHATFRMHASLNTITLRIIEMSAARALYAYAQVIENIRVTQSLQRDRSHLWFRSRRCSMHSHYPHTFGTGHTYCDVSIASAAPPGSHCKINVNSALECVLLCVCLRGSYIWARIRIILLALEICDRQPPPACGNYAVVISNPHSVGGRAGVARGYAYNSIRYYRSINEWNGVTNKKKSENGIINLFDVSNLDLVCLFEIFDYISIDYY